MCSNAAGSAKARRLLVHGGTSGIGSMAIMLGKLFGLTIVTTCGSDEKCAAARSIGADLAINYKTQDFVEEVSAFTSGKGVEVVLDMVAGDYVAAQPQVPCRRWPPRDDRGAGRS